MNKFNFSNVKFIFSAAALGFLLFSCSTVTVETATPLEETGDVLQGGAILTGYFKTPVDNDIFLSGKIKDWDIPKSTTEKVIDFFFGSNSISRQWVGSLNLGNAEQYVNVRYFSYFRNVKENSGTTEYTRKETCSVRLTGETEGFDGFVFSEFDVDFGSSTDMVNSDSLPYNFMEFTFEGRNFFVQITNSSTDYVNLFGKPESFKKEKFELINDSGQLFQIADENGIVFAQFDSSSYRIFDALEDFDEQTLLPAVAYVRIVQEILSYEK